jgi:hypothetical protein
MCHIKKTIKAIGVAKKTMPFTEIYLIQFSDSIVVICLNVMRLCGKSVCLKQGVENM